MWPFTSDVEKKCDILFKMVSNLKEQLALTQAQVLILAEKLEGQSAKK